MKKFLKYLFILNTLFSLLTIISSVYSLIIGDTTDTHIHIISRFIISIIAVTGIALYDKIRIKKYYILLPIHYVIMMSLVFTYIWILSYFVTLHPRAYRDILFNFTIPYIIIAPIIIVVDSIKIKKERCTPGNPAPTHKNPV